MTFVQNQKTWRQLTEKTLKQTLNDSEGLSSILWWKGWQSGWVELNSGGLRSKFITKHSYIISSTFTFPRLFAESILAARVRYASLAFRSSPSHTTPTFTRFGAKSSGFITSWTTNGFVAKVSSPTRLAFAFHGLCAVAIVSATREFYTLVTIWSKPSWMAYAFSWLATMTMLTTFFANGWKSSKSKWEMSKRNLKFSYVYHKTFQSIQLHICTQMEFRSIHWHIQVSTHIGSNQDQCTQPHTHNDLVWYNFLVPLHMVDHRWGLDSSVFHFPNRADTRYAHSCHKCSDHWPVKSSV